MSWKGLLVPVVSIASCLGCVAFSYLIQISVKSFRKKIVFSLLLIQLSIVALLYLIPQLVLVVLFLLDMWIVSPEVEWLGAAFSKYLPRFSLLVLPFFLQVEMHISERKQRLHSKLDNTRCGGMLTVVLTVGLALLTYVLVFSGMLKTYLFPSERLSLVTPILELTIAIIGLSIYFAASRTSRNAYLTPAKAKKAACVNIVSRFCATIFITFIIVDILRITLAVGHNALMYIGCTIVECIALLTDICLLSLAPLILLRKSKTFKELNGLKNICSEPSVQPPQIQGTLLPRRDQGNGRVKLMTLKRKKSVRQQIRKTSTPCQRLINRVEKKERRFSCPDSVDSSTTLPELGNLRKISSSSIFDSDSLASKFSVPRMLPQFKDIPEDDIQENVENKETKGETVLPLWTSVRIPGMVCSVPSSPVAILMESFTSSDWEKCSRIITPTGFFDQTITDQSVTKTCWRFGQDTRRSRTDPDSVYTLQASSELRLLDVSPELRMDYIQHALDHKKSTGAAANLPGFIPSPLPCSPQPMSLSETDCVFGVDNHSLQENTTIAMLFDS